MAKAPKWGVNTYVESTKPQIGRHLKWLKKERAANKKAAFGLSKNLEDPKFRATEKIMKYKKQRYFG